MPRGRAPPSRDEILEFISDSPTPVGKREIARAFGLRGADRAVIDDILRQLEREGVLGRRGPHARRRAKALPPVAVIEVISVDTDGEALARPHSGADVDAPPPVIRLRHDRRPGIAWAPGDRILARLEATDAGDYLARAIRRLPAEAPRTVLGVFDLVDGHGRLRPTSRKVKAEIRIARRDAKGARPGELVRVEVQPGRRLGLAEARVLDRLGEGEPWQTASLIAIEENDIPDRFAADALAEAEAAGPAPLGAREDLRDVALVTIDDETARDFDDAVWAEPDADPDNPGGFHLIVAVADVAWYVRPGGALDRAARERGNSAYFPDRVVPMLPEALSSGWCSLKPDEDRPCLAAHLWIDATGRKRRHRFVRAMMRSAARLTYRGVQAAVDGTAPGSVPQSVVGPAFAAYRALAESRARRGTLDLDIPERRVVLAADGRVERIDRREILPSHRLIEEFMILANVAAAETLEARGAPCAYRVHDTPDDAKVEALREMLGTLGLRLPRGQVLRARDFARLLDDTAGSPHAALVHEAVLRTQAQAAYSPQNIGHFGLALRRYVHFTSPIRRYADLLVHRAMIGALGLGAGGLDEAAGAGLDAVCKHISSTERRAAAAERQAVDRLAAAYLADRVGAELDAYVTGLTRAGAFVRLEETGADALIPLSFLGVRPLRVDAHGHRLVAGRDETVIRLGDRVRVRLREVDTLTGSLVCDLAGAARQRQGGGAGRPKGKHPPRRRRGRAAR